MARPVEGFPAVPTDPVITVRLAYELRATKHLFRYRELTEPHEWPALGRLHLSKETWRALGKPTTLTVTVEAG